jgi:hypothetical protein
MQSNPWPQEQTSISSDGLPASLTLDEVARVQSLLADGVAMLGFKLVSILIARCKAMLSELKPVFSREGAASSPPAQRAIATAVMRCHRLVQTQISMCHNLKRWLHVLDAPDCDFGGPYSPFAPPRLPSSNPSATGLFECLEQEAEILRQVTERGRQLVGSVEAAGLQQPVELLLGNGIRPLGKKSLGSVWMHHLGAEFVAVKWITIVDDTPGRGYSASQKQSMLIREVEAMMLLKHPNIVRLLGITTMDTPADLRNASDSSTLHDSSVDGGSLARPRGKLAEQVTIGIVLELCFHGTMQVSGSH